jgi:hypothetical protein
MRLLGAHVRAVFAAVGLHVECPFNAARRRKITRETFLGRNGMVGGETRAFENGQPAAGATFQRRKPSVSFVFNAQGFAQPQPMSIRTVSTVHP